LIEGGLNKFFLKLLQLTKEGKSNLEVLIAFQTKMEPSTIKILTEIIQLDKSKLKCLTLSENKFNNEEGKKFFRAMVKNKSVEELIMYKCDLDNEIADDIVYMLNNNKSLISVNLYDNKIDDPDKMTQIVACTQSIYKDEEEKEKKEKIKKITHSQSNQNYKQITDYQEESTRSDTFIDESISEETFNKLYENNPKIRNLDLSKNKCRDSSQILIEVLNCVDIEMLDLTQNLILEENNEKLEDIVERKNPYNKIIF
jgi:hypothetical protein